MDTTETAKIQRDLHPGMSDEACVIHAACAIAERLVVPDEIPVDANGRPTLEYAGRVLRALRWPRTHHNHQVVRDILADFRAAYAASDAEALEVGSIVVACAADVDLEREWPELLAVRHRGEGGDAA